MSKRPKRIKKLGFRTPRTFISQQLRKLKKARSRTSSV